MKNIILLLCVCFGLAFSEANCMEVALHQPHPLIEMQEVAGNGGDAVERGAPYHNEVRMIGEQLRLLREDRQANRREQRCFTICGLVIGALNLGTVAIAGLGLFFTVLNNWK